MSILLLTSISYMIYNEGYKIKFYRDSRTGKSRAFDFIESLDKRIQSKIYKYLHYLKEHEAYLDEPYSRHITGKIRELRIDFAHNRYRIFYFCLIGRNIIILHVYSKKTARTPIGEIARAEACLFDCLNNIEKYE